MRRKNIAIIVLSIVLIGVVITSIILMNNYSTESNDLSVKNKDLQRQLTETITNLEEINEELNIMKNELASNDTTNEKLSDDNEKLINDNEKKTYKYKIPLVIDETNIYVEVKQGKYPIEKVEFFYNNKLLFTDTEKPYEFMLNKISIGFQKIKVIVYDTKGNSATDQMKIWFLNILKNN